MDGLAIPSIAWFVGELAHPESVCVPTVTDQLIQAEQARGAIQHPFSLFYFHHLGIFPQSPPTRVGRRRGLGFRPRRSSTIGRHRTSEFGRDGVWVWAVRV